MIEATNAALRRQADAHGAPFLDNNLILGPLWDHAADFCHPEGRVLKHIVSRVCAFLCEPGANRSVAARCGEASLIEGDMAERSPMPDGAHSWERPGASHQYGHQFG